MMMIMMILMILMILEMRTYDDYDDYDDSPSPGDALSMCVNRERLWNGSPQHQERTEPGSLTLGHTRVKSAVKGCKHGGLHYFEATKT